MANLITKRRIIFSGINYSRQAEEWFGVLSSQPSGVMKTIYDNYYFKPLVRTGIFAELDRFFEFGGEIEANGLISLKNPTTATAATKVGTVTWTQFQGGAGNGVDGYYNFNYIPSSDGVKFTQDSASAFFYSRTNNVGAFVDMGSADAALANGTLLVARFTGDAQSIRVNAATAVTLSANTNSQGFYMAKRTASNALEGFKNGVSTGSGTVASTGLSSRRIYLGGYNSNGTLTNPTTRQYSNGGTGSSNINEVTLYNIVQAFRSQLQTQV